MFRLAKTTAGAATSTSRTNGGHSAHRDHHELSGPSNVRARPIARYNSDSSNDEPVEDLQPSGILDREAMSGHFSLQNLLGNEPHVTSASHRVNDEDPILLGLVNPAIARSLFDRYVLGEVSHRGPTEVTTYVLDCICNSSGFRLLPGLY